VAALVSGLALGRSAAIGATRLWVVAGLLLGLAGLAVRFYTVGHAPSGTSGRHREQHAERLNTFGVYSIVRHPLYLGNVLVWVGISCSSAWPAGALASSLFGLLVFAAIVRHEDAFLGARFGEPFREWAAATPAFLPRPGLWRSGREEVDWVRAIASEYSTLHTMGLLALLFAAVRAAASGGRPTMVWWVLFGANSGLYLLLRRWRRSRAARERAGARAAIDEGRVQEGPAGRPS
jgi:protein-S-isoprenylcysteine O-methyltransferase Ste14